MFIRTDICELSVEVILIALHTARKAPKQFYPPHVGGLLSTLHFFNSKIPKITDTSEYLRNLFDEWDFHLFSLYTGISF